jgi:hypothetical protein
MINDQEIDHLLKNEYAKVQQLGFRIKLQCIICGAIFDADDIRLSFQHKENCRIIHGVK